MSSRYEWTFDVKTTSATKTFPELLAAIGKEAKKTDAALYELVVTARLLGSAFREASKPFASFTKGLQTASAAQHHATQRQRDTVKASTAATKATQVQSTSWTRLAGVFNTWNKAARFVVADLKLLFQGVTALTRGTISFIGTVAKETASFDALEGQLRALLGTSKDASQQFESLRDTASEMGKQPNINAEQALKTMIDLKKAGNEYAQILDRTPTAIRLGQAEGKDPAKMAKAASVAWNTFDKEMERTGKTFEDVGSLMEATVTGSFLDSITQISDSLKNGGETAKGFGLSMEETMTVLGQFANKNLTAGRAGTAMRGIFSRLSRTEMPAVKKALQELGVSVVDSAGKFRDWPVLVEELRQSFATVQSDAKKMNLYEALGGGHYKDFLKILIEQGAEGFNRQREAILKNVDALGRLQQEQSETYGAAEKTYESAVSNFWRSWKNILKLPVKEYYQNVANIINTVATRISDVSKQFQEGKGSLKDWLSAIQSGEFTGMFAGLKEQIEPYLAALKVLVAGVAKATVSVLKSAISEILNGETKEQLLTLGIEIGAAIAQGIIKGTKEAAKSAWEMMKSADDSQYQTESDLWMGAAGVNIPQPPSGTGGDSGGGGSSLDATTGATPPKVYAPAPSSGPSSWSGIFNTLDYRNTDPLETYETPGDKAKRDYVEQARSKRKVQTLSPISFQRGENGELVLNDAATTQLAGRRHLRNTVNTPDALPRTTERIDFDLQKLQQTDQTKSTREALATGIDKAKLAVVQMGGEFKKWLVEPVNEFLQAMTQIKVKFDDIFSGLKSKKIDIGEKFGLTSKEDASKQRYQVALSQYQTTKRRLGGAQTAEERAQIQEKLAGQAETLAGMTTGGQQKTFAREAQRHLQGGIGDYEHAERIELQRKQIEYDTTRESIPLLQKMQGKMETSSGELSVVQQLQSAYKQLGKGDAAASLQKRINTLTIQQAEEQAKYLKLQLEKLDISNQHLADMDTKLAELTQESKVQTKLQQDAPLPAEPTLQFN